MINKIVFVEDWRCFKAGDCFDFRPGVNLLVGDQGCGKSSLYMLFMARARKNRLYSNEKLLKKVLIYCDAGPVYSKDFEHENPRMKKGLEDDPRFQISSMFSSHGECNRTIVTAMSTAKSCVVLLDEPDTALSIRSCKLLVKQFKELAAGGSQVIAAVHNIQVIKEFREVLSLEHRKWMWAQDFITTQLMEEVNAT